MYRYGSSDLHEAILEFLRGKKEVPEFLLFNEGYGFISIGKTADKAGDKVAYYDSICARIELYPH